MPEVSTAAVTAPLRPAPLWARLLLPSATDLIFLVFFVQLTFGSWAPRLLGDADTGWHIRNGERILHTLSVPRTDYFSYTMAGHTWYAWEWLYDALVGGIHLAAGLNGVVVFTALVLALTIALLFRHTLARSENVPIAAILTLIATAAATIHFLARPHVVTWLLALIWFTALDAHHRGLRTQVYWLAPLMLVWVNVHGGFLLGLILLAVFLVADLWTASTANCPKRRGRARERTRHLAVVSALSAAATLITPYGFRLYVHLYGYLASPFLMDNISEFRSPNFHEVQGKFFIALLVLTVLALVLGAAKVRPVDLLVVALSIWMALFAARNIPIASILLALTIAPLLGEALRALPERKDITFRLRALATSVVMFGARMHAAERRFHAHILATAVVVLAIAASLHHGDLLGRKLLDARFNPRDMPVAAAEYLATHDIHDHFFSPDHWGGYLIYRFYPQPPIKLFIDDRHDFYGEPFVRDYLKVTHVELGWREVLDRYGVRYVLIPPNSALANTLKATPDWRVVYDDGVAIIFSR